MEGRGGCVFTPGCILPLWAGNLERLSSSTQSHQLQPETLRAASLPPGPIQDLEKPALVTRTHTQSPYLKAPADTATGSKLTTVHSDLGH